MAESKKKVSHREADENEELTRNHPKRLKMRKKIDEDIDLEEERRSAYLQNRIARKRI